MQQSRAREVGLSVVGGAGKRKGVKGASRLGEECWPCWVGAGIGEGRLWIWGGRAEWDAVGPTGLCRLRDIQAETEAAGGMHAWSRGDTNLGALSGAMVFVAGATMG